MITGLTCFFLLRNKLKLFAQTKYYYEERKKETKKNN